MRVERLRKSVEGAFFNFSTFQLFNCSTFQPRRRRAARFPLPRAAPSARRELATGTPKNKRLPMNPAKPKDLKEKAPDPQSVDVLKEIQEWFQNQCDGGWEHARRITLDSCDNPGWWLKIDLQGTNLENKQFNLKTAVQATHSRAGAHAHGGKTFSPPSLNG